MFSERTTGQTVKVTGDVQRSKTKGQLANSISNNKDNINTFSITQGTPRLASAKNSYCPRGNEWSETTDIKGNLCCKRVEKTRRSLF